MKAQKVTICKQISTPRQDSATQGQATYMCVCVYVHVCVHVCVYAYVCMHVHESVRVYAYASCMCVCACAHACCVMSEVCLVYVKKE